MDKAIDTLEFLREYLNYEVHPNCEYYIYSNLSGIADKALAELKAKDEAYAKLQQAYDNLTAQYQKDVNELKAKLEPKTCDGCEYEDDKRGGHCYAFHTHCSREPAADHYTPRKGE